MFSEWIPDLKNWKTVRIKKGHLIAVVLIAFFVVLGITSFKETMVPYVSIEEAKHSRKVVQIIGNVVAESRTWYDDQKMDFHFTLRDRNGDTARVTFSGKKPENFEQAPSIVVIGEYRDTQFYAESILTKCPSKYEE
jgi:cytochrome c-type biogenesis protein CcmE